MNLQSSQILLIEEAIEYLEPMLNRKLSMTELYLLILRNSLTVSVNLFEQVTAQQGRYIPSNEEGYDKLKSRNEKRKLKKWKWVDLDEIHFDKIKKRHYAFSEKKIKITGVWNLSLLGTEAKSIESLLMYEKGGNSITIDSGHVLLTRGNRICKLICAASHKTLLENQAQNYSSLNDFSHILVIKKDNLNKLAKKLKLQTTKSKPKEIPLTSKGKNTIKMMIKAFLLNQGIQLEQYNKMDLISQLSKWIKMNDLKLPDETINQCVTVLKIESPSETLLATIKEEELLIILGGLLNNNKPEIGTTPTEHIIKLITASKEVALGEKTINKYLDKIANIDKSKYRLYKEDCLV